MDVLSAAIPDMVRIEQFGSSSEFLVRWSSLSWLQRYLSAHGYKSSVSAVPDPDSSHSRLSFASEHRAQCFPGHSRMLPGGGGESWFSYPGPCCNLSPLHFTPKELFAECDMVNVDWQEVELFRSRVSRQVCGRVFRLLGLPPACLWGNILTRLIQESWCRKLFVINNF